MMRYAVFICNTYDGLCNAHDKPYPFTTHAFNAAMLKQVTMHAMCARQVECVHIDL